MEYLVSSGLKKVDNMPSPTAKYTVAKNSHDTGSWDKSCILMVTDSEYNVLQKMLNPRTENLPYDPESFEKYMEFINKVKALKGSKSWIK